MGTKMAPSYANIFMGKLEETFLQPRSHHPGLWRRSIDDILLVWTHPEEELAKMLTDLNSFHSTIKFTWTASNTSVNFLDLTLYKGERFQQNGILVVKTFYKPTNSFQYLHYNSSHPRGNFRGIITGEATRLLLSNSDKNQYEAALKKPTDTPTIERGYPKKSIQKTFLELPQQASQINHPEHHHS